MGHAIVDDVGDGKRNFENSDDEDLLSSQQQEIQSGRDQRTQRVRLLPEHGARGHCVAVDVQHNLLDNLAEGVHSSLQGARDAKKPVDL
jgi:hypothetical protein